MSENKRFNGDYNIESTLGASTGSVNIVDTPLTLGSFTTTERDALTASNGMLIYNSTLDKVQAREAGSWVSLT
ncbi:uncharacterized protein METZ01_LOCUS222765 [marine metagenome]|uniref:Major tropism determinant N-terminal domain-containing protein n=1 Tax=marine metagenome TaxID=408172 RepID=A0A382G6U5_9ZZZZ